MGIFDKAKKAAEEAAEKAKSIASDVSDGIGNAVDYVKEEGVSGVAGDAATFVANTADKVVETAVDAKNSVVDYYDVVANTDLETVESYCSWCNQKTKAILHTKSTIGRSVYECRNPDCKDHEGSPNKVVQCRACENKAKYTDKWGVNLDEQFCSVHNGEIANFEYLDEQLDEITDFHRIVERDQVNMNRIAKTGAITLGGAVVIGPLAYYAAPAVGGAVGSLMGYSGAVATNVGLATMGGGALAAGGAGMAGGTVVVSAVGGALGGRMGGVVSNSYFSDIEGFNIRKVREGEEPALICIDGFLTQDIDTAEDWLESLPDHFSNQAVYVVDWESKRLRDIANTFSAVSVKQGGLKAGISGFAKRAAKSAPARIGPLANVLAVADLIDNPWHVARYKAEETGILLADLIARTDQKFILMGHSLGSRVIFQCLSALRTKEEKCWVDSVYLLGGAVNNDVSEQDEPGSSWYLVDKAVSGQIHNFYSENDAVLKYLYNASQLFSGKSIGRNPIGLPGVKNHDVTAEISGHTEYKKQLKTIFSALNKS